MVLLALVISCPLRPKAEDEQTCEASIERECMRPPEFLCCEVGVTSLGLKTVVYKPSTGEQHPKRVVKVLVHAERILKLFDGKPPVF